MENGATATWIDPSGVSWDLTNSDLGWFILDEVPGEGLGAVPISIATQPSWDGGVDVLNVQPLARTVTLPIHIYGSTPSEFLSRWRSLAGAFASTRRLGPGTIQITRGDGSVRQIAAYYADGFSGRPGHGYVEDDVVLQLLCPTPYWTDPSPTELVRTFGTTSSYFTPYPTVSSSQIIGSSVLNNPGDAVTYPTWTITGPGSSVIATNTTTGESWTLDPSASAVAYGPLLTGDVVTVQTRPMKIRGPSGQVWTGAINFPDATLWGLQPGDNSVSIVVAGASSGTRISVVFNPRYETA